MVYLDQQAELGAWPNILEAEFTRLRSKHQNDLVKLAEEKGFVGFHAQVTPLETPEQIKKRGNL